MCVCVCVCVIVKVHVFIARTILYLQVMKCRNSSHTPLAVLVTLYTWPHPYIIAMLMTNVRADYFGALIL